MHQNPKVSVLLATYNRPQFLGRAIESVVGQSFADWELIVVDDGSDIETLGLMKSWEAKDSRIRYFRIPRIGRIAKVSNFGLQQARGKYVAILDDDDYWADSEKLRKQVEFLDDHRDYVACGGGYITVNEHGEKTGKFLKPEADRVIRKKLLIANQFANASTMFRLSAAREVGFYDESMLQFADWDFWLKLGQKGRLYNFQEILLYYQMWDRSASFSKQREAARSGFRIVLRHRKTYFGFSLAFFWMVLYGGYAYLPAPIKKFLNARLSRIKKSLFSK